ncbi:MAG: DNA adenine methylase [candidate division WOR-3 bacterium]
MRTAQQAGGLPQPQYLGNKAKFVDWIFENTPKANSIFDAFSGSSVVGYKFKRNGWQVYSNDFLKFCSNIAKAVIENNNVKLTESDIKLLFARNRDADTFITEKFSNIFYTKEECEFIDNLRANINQLDNEYKQALAFTAAYRMLTRKVLFGYFCHTKAMDYRRHEHRVARNPSINQVMDGLLLKMIHNYNQAVFDNGKQNVVFNDNTLNVISNVQADVAYFDPPYVGIHPDYQGYYHFLETFTNYWKDMKLINRTRMYADKKFSGFTRRKEILASFKKLFELSEHIPYWVISYNSRAYPSKDELISLIKEFRKVDLIEYKYENNVGGMGAREHSNEYLFVCRPTNTE